MDMAASDLNHERTKEIIIDGSGRPTYMLPRFLQVLAWCLSSGSSLIYNFHQQTYFDPCMFFCCWVDGIEFRSVKSCCRTTARFLCDKFLLISVQEQSLLFSFTRRSPSSSRDRC